MRSDRCRSLRACGDVRCERVAKGEAESVAARERIEPGEQPDDEVVAGGRQSLAPADQAIGLRARGREVELGACASHAAFARVDAFAFGEATAQVTAVACEEDRRRPVAEGA